VTRDDSLVDPWWTPDYVVTLGNASPDIAHGDLPASSCSASAREKGQFETATALILIVRSAHTNAGLWRSHAGLAGLNR
jgi:hypothetical protein